MATEERVKGRVQDESEAEGTSQIIHRLADRNIMNFIDKAMILIPESDMIRLHFQKITQAIGRERMYEN